MVYWWVAASVIANVAIIATEYLNRTQPSLGEAVTRTWPLIVIAQVCLFFCWNRAPHWMVAWAVFTIGNSLMRVAVVSAMPGEPMRLWWVALGVALMLAGGLSIKLGMVR